VSIQIEFDALESKKCVVFRFDWSGNQTLLRLQNTFEGYESIRLVLLSDQVSTKNVENSQSYLIKYISLAIRKTLKM
jgi:hypothetical protein